MHTQEYFKQLVLDGLYDNTMQSDRIALLAVYIPMIRTELHQFASLWNSHRIRKQSNKPNSIPGKPRDLYNYPEAQGDINEGIHINPVIAQQLKSEYGLDEWSMFFRFFHEFELKNNLGLFSSYIQSNEHV
jgi:hypothetical protein